MTLGMDPRPLEGADDTKVTVEPQGAGKTVISVSDPEVKALLGRIAAAVESIDDRLKLVLGG